MKENVTFVAEVSSNHHQDLSRCLAFIDTAARIGCHAVKFQLFRIDELFAPEVLAKSESHRQRRQWELPVAFLPELAERCRVNGIEFACTPFYLGAVQALEPFVAFYKVASYELLWTDLLKACAETGKPIVLSTGMATLPEIRSAVETLRESGCIDLTLLHCVSGYSTPLEEANLKVLETLRSEFGCKVGWSDHTVNPTVIQRAVHRWQASVIEFHLDLDRDGAEYNQGHCWLPSDISPVIADIGLAAAIDGDGTKRPMPSEAADRSWRADPSDGLRPLIETRRRY